MALDIPLRKTALGQKNISFLGPKIWSKISNGLKVVKTTNCFTHGKCKNVKNSPKSKIKITSVSHHISGTVYHMIMIFATFV